MFALKSQSISRWCSIIFRTASLKLEISVASKPKATGPNPTLVNLKSPSGKSPSTALVTPLT